MKYNPSTKQAFQLIHDGLITLSRASQYGMCVDVDYCNSINQKLTKKINKYQNKFIKSETGKLWKETFYNINLNSDDQLREILYKKLQIKCPKKTKKDNNSVDNEVLEIITDELPEIEFLNKVRKYKKVQKTYIQGYLKEQINGVMHPNFNLHTVTSFRSSSDSPNFQNNPKRDPEQKKLCRKAIKPRPGNQLIAADFSGIEVAIAECYHKDPVMKKYIIDEKSDMHRDVAIQIFCLDEFKKEGSEKILRNGAKNGFVFPQFYGDYYANNAPILCKWAELPRYGIFKKTDGLALSNGKTVGEQLISNGIKSFSQFEDHIRKIENDFWENRFRVYNDWKKQWYEQYIENAYMHTKTGFTIHGLLSKNQIINLPVQGSAFHCLLKTLNKMDQVGIEYKWKTRIIGQIHDEMIFDANPDEKNKLIDTICKIACTWLPEQWKWINVPLRLEVDIFPINGSWAEKPETIKLG